MCPRNRKWYWRERKRVLETFYVKWNFVINVNCDCNKKICEALIIITFPGKQTIMKHDTNKFNLTQFECRIQNLINLEVNRKKLMWFSCFCHSKYHKSIMPPPQYDFFNDVYFFLWTAILSKLSIFYQLASEKNEVHTGNLTHYRQTLQLINP